MHGDKRISNNIKSLLYVFSCGLVWFCGLSKNDPCVVLSECEDLCELINTYSNRYHCLCHYQNVWFLIICFNWIVNTRPPQLINCPPCKIKTNKVDSLSYKLTWIEPDAWEPFDNVTLLVKTHAPGDVFPVGSTSVVYFFVDSSFNLAVCNFTVYVDDDNAFIGMF